MKFKQYITESKKVINQKISKFMKGQGYKEYSHDPQGEGYHSTKAPVTFKELNDMILSIYPRSFKGVNQWDGSSIWGKKIMGKTTWVIEIPASPYTRFTITISSKDGTHVFDVYAKISVAKD
jgi:hypothetical protein